MFALVSLTNASPSEHIFHYIRTHYSLEILNSKTIYKHRTHLHELADKHWVRVIWVAEHVNISGNYKSDELARLVTIIRLPSEFGTVGILLQTCGCIIDSAILDFFNARWATLEKSKNLWQNWKESIPLICLNSKEQIGRSPYRTLNNGFPYRVHGHETPSKRFLQTL